MLVLGGTNYIGPAIVRELVAAGHEITLLNRGITNPDLLPEVPRIRADRTKGEEAFRQVRDRRWDIVIDTWPDDPGVVSASAKALANATERYVFVSTVSAYADLARPGTKEDAPLAPATSPNAYGAKKASCERAVQSFFPERCIIVRPAVILGPTDPNDSLRFWLVRLDRGGQVLAAGDGLDPVQYVDVRDLAQWLAMLVGSDVVGTFNVAGPAGPLTFAEFVHGCKAVTATPSLVVWVSQDFLAERQVRPWVDLPLWMPRTVSRGWQTIDASKARGLGLLHRPLAETARDTLHAFRQNYPPDYRLGAPGRYGGMTRERELELLAAWRLRW